MRNVCSRFQLGAGPKQLSYDAVLPVILVPLLTLLAAQNLTCTILVALVTPPIISYLNHNFLRFVVRTKFFFMWTLVSVTGLLVTFQTSVVPLLEILPEENFVFVVCVVGGLLCGYKTRQTADQANQDVPLLDGLELGEGDDEEFCGVCRKRVPLKAYHCRSCQTCVLNREYHCKWLDCCIGSGNLRWYLGCLSFSALAFIYGSNLTMTSVCHPFILVASILMPDDCSDVYHQLDIAICFVSSVYSLIIGLVLLAYLIYHFWLIYQGTTSHERHYDENTTWGKLGKYFSQIYCCNT